ncbi:MAG: hypothetical protein ACTSQ8_06580 [Candidatus Helarchaeota archaeon]
MALGVQEIAFLVITVLFGILFGLFVWQTTRRHRSATALVASLFVGVLASFFAIISTGQLIPLNSIEATTFQALQLNTFGVQFFLFFLFLERLRSKDIHTGRLAIMLSLLLVQTLSLWLRVYFNDIGEIHQTLWFLSDMSYTLSGIFVYLMLSVPTYVTTYRYTHEKKPIFITIALSLIGIGFVFSFLFDLFDYFNINVGWIKVAAEYTMPLQAIGLFIFTSIYLSDIDYLYRLPNDTFMLMVVAKSGVPLHSVKLKTRKQVKIEGDLLSGLLSAINNVFQEVFKVNSTIRKISSEEVHILLEPGSEIISIIITDKISYFLDIALKRYAREFEKMFSEELRAKTRDIAAYHDAIKLIQPIFPFFIIDKVIGD